MPTSQKYYSPPQFTRPYGQKTEPGIITLALNLNPARIVLRLKHYEINNFLTILISIKPNVHIVCVGLLFLCHILSRCSIYISKRTNFTVQIVEHNSCHFTGETIDYN